MAPLDSNVDPEMVVFTLKVKTADGKSFKLENLNTELTVLDLKELCVDHCEIAAAHQRLFLKSKELEDSLSLQSTNVRENSTLFLTKSSAWKKELSTVPVGTVPCAGGCGSHGTSRTDNFCSSCFAKQSQAARDRIWKGVFAEDAQEKVVESRKRSRIEEAPDLDSLIVGAPVRVHGLQGAKELNGRLGWIIKYLEDSARYSVKLKGEEGTKAMKASNLKRLDNVKPLTASKVLVQRDRTKCWSCGRKCGLAGFECRCGYVFCSRCRHAEDHGCDFDHRRLGQELISKSNPKLEDKHWDLLAGL